MGGVIKVLGGIKVVPRVVKILLGVSEEYWRYHISTERCQDSTGECR